MEEQIKSFIQSWNNNISEIEAHTSGSTGAPKKILLPRRLLIESARRSISHFGLNSNSVIHLILSPEYIAGKMAIVRALEAGCKLTWEDPSSAPLSSGNVPQRISLLSAVGAQIESLVSLKRNGNLPKIEHLLLGGSPLTKEMRQMSMQLADNVWESYGMTETASHIALRPITCDETPFMPLGGISISSDERGCLIINMPTAGKLVTNDLVEIDRSTGGFYILGRVDNVIISGGLKVVPEIVEQQLSPYMPEGSVFYITSRPHSKWGEEVILIKENSNERQIQELPLNYIETPQGPLAEICKKILPPQSRPQAIIEVPHIQRTATGKIRRQRIDFTID